MAYHRRILFTDRQKSEIWDRWQRGESMSSIGRSFNRNSSSIHPFIACTDSGRPDRKGTNQREPNARRVNVFRRCSDP
jgi:hypothetical protein